jgi:hypothetical protein
LVFAKPDSGLHTVAQPNFIRAILVADQWLSSRRPVYSLGQRGP